MLNHQRELSLPRFTAVPTADRSAFFNTRVSVAAGPGGAATPCPEAAPIARGARSTSSSARRRALGSPA